MMKRLIFLLITMVVIIVTVLTNHQISSFTLLTILLCGVLTINNIYEAINRVNFATDAYFYTWIFLFISTFVAPLIHVCRDYWVPNFNPRPHDWSIYACITSIMYLIGILILQNIFKNKLRLNVTRTRFRVLRSNWKLIIFLFLLISLIAQIYVYSKLGGITGYINAFTEKAEDSNAFAGMGMFFILSESFPYTLLIYLIFKYRNRHVGKLGFYLILIVLFVVTLFFGGLRGSRSNTILFMVVSTIAINIYVYKIKKSDLSVLLIGFFVFMFIGRMYKDYGANMLNETTTTVQSNTNLTSLESTITGDLARYDVNAYQLFVLEEVRPHYNLRWGETYLWGLFTYMPGGSYIIKALDLEGRSRAAAELFYGSSDYKNSRILGPIGEWFVNFGRFSFFIIYIFLGYTIRYIRKYTQSLSIDDVRYMIAPSLMVFLPQLLLSDSSNIIFFFVKRVIIVMIVLYAISKKSYIIK